MNNKVGECVSWENIMLRDVEWKITEYIVRSSIEMQEIKTKQPPQDGVHKTEQQYPFCC